MFTFQNKYRKKILGLTYLFFQSISRTVLMKQGIHLACFESVWRQGISKLSFRSQLSITFELLGEVLFLWSVNLNADVSKCELFVYKSVAHNSSLILFEVLQNSFAYAAPTLWNGLPKHLCQFAHPLNPPLNFTYPPLALSSPTFHSRLVGCSSLTTLFHIEDD